MPDELTRSPISPALLQKMRAWIAAGNRGRIVLHVVHGEAQQYEFHDCGSARELEEATPASSSSG